MPTVPAPRPCGHDAQRLGSRGRFIKWRVGPSGTGEGTLNLAPAVLTQFHKLHNCGASPGPSRASASAWGSTRPARPLRIALAGGHRGRYRPRGTGFTRICCGASVLSDPTRCGVPTLPTYRWRTAFCIWWRSWTGGAARFWRSVCRTPWIYSSASMRWMRRWAGMACRIYSTPIKAASSRRGCGRSA